MALLHKFFLVEREWYLQSKSSEDSLQLHLELEKCENLPNRGIKDAVEIHDDLIRYMYDTLKWVPTYNTANRKFDFFINLYGITLIDKRNAVWIKNIFNAWASLFSYAPEHFELTGGYYTIEGKEEGGYEIIKVDRNEIVITLKKIASFAERTMESNMLILHNGI